MHATKVAAELDRVDLLRGELARARRDAIAAGMRFRLLVHDEGADLAALAEAAAAIGLEAGRVAGFARMLAALTK